MRLAQPFDPIEVGEIDNFVFDFLPDMGGATMVSTSWTCSLLAASSLPGVTDPSPQSHILSAAPATAIQVRSVIDGSIVTKSGVFSVASVGGFPLSAAGGVYVLEAIATCSDGRNLRLNSTVTVRLPGP